MSTKETLLLILKAYFNDSYDIKIDVNINELYKLSTSLNVATIVSYVLNKINIKGTIFDKIAYKAINKYERLNNLKNDVDNLLNNKFDYLFIKGLTVAKYYNEPYLRYSSDVDVVVKDKYEEVCKILINNGYKKKFSTVQEIAFIKNGFIVDLHHKFNEFNDNHELIYRDTFNNTHELAINYKYLYLLIHTSKHLLSGQLDLRSFIDLYYLRKIIDKDIVNKLLIDADLVIFNDTINSYLDVLMGNKEYSDIDRRLEEFIFSYGDDFGANNKVLINRYGKSRLSYILSRVFVSYEEMAAKYPVLYKYKLLLPVFYVVRLFRPIKLKTSKYAQNELKNSTKIVKKDVEDMHIFIQNIGLK